MHYSTDYKLEDFILNTRWQDVPDEVRQRTRGCLVDLMGALIVGSRSEQFRAGLRLAETLFPAGRVPVVGSEKTFGLVGAASAMGHSSNAYDIDDGHNLIRAHPGTSFVGPLLAAAWEKDLSRDELLAALLVAYETTIRSGAAIMDYYKFAHSSGTFGAVGTVAGAGRLLGLDRETLNNALSVAEFNAPLVPGIRSVEYPSMNKDGVPFGVMIGMLALAACESGFTGNKNLLEADEYRHCLDDLGQNWEVMNLYFKPYPCCRWAHPAIDACLSLMRENGLRPEEIAHVTVDTFYKATQLSKIVPKTVDEAQYNIAYPVAASLVCGNFGLAQLRKEALGDPRVVEMMGKLEFRTEPKFDEQFPAHRICRATIVTKDGRTLVSKEFEPSGEACEHIGLDWLTDKFRRVTGAVFSKEGQDALLGLITGEENVPVRKIVETVNKAEYWLDS